MPFDHVQLLIIMTINKAIKQKWYKQTSLLFSLYNKSSEKGENVLNVFNFLKILIQVPRLNFLV